MKRNRAPNVLSLINYPASRRGGELRKSSEEDGKPAETVRPALFRPVTRVFTIPRTNVERILGAWKDTEPRILFLLFLSSSAGRKIKLELAAIALESRRALWNFYHPQSGHWIFRTRNYKWPGYWMGPSKPRSSRRFPSRNFTILLFRSEKRTKRRMEKNLRQKYVIAGSIVQVSNFVKFWNW